MKIKLTLGFITKKENILSPVLINEKHRSFSIENAPLFIYGSLQIVYHFHDKRYAILKKLWVQRWPLCLLELGYSIFKSL